MVNMGERVRLADGRTLVFEEIDASFFQGTAGDTPKHEVKHGLLAERTGTPVEFITIVPNPAEGYAGLTRLTRANATSAVGPAIDGHGGVEHDLKIAKMIGGESSARSEARSLLARNRRAIHALSVVLEREKSQSGGRFREVLAKFDNGPLFRVRIISPEGKETHKTLNGKRDSSGNPLTLPIDVPPLQQNGKQTKITATVRSK